MIYLALAFLGCLAAALALALPAFLRPPPAEASDEESQKQTNIAAARERLRALRAAAANGELTQQEADEYAMEIESALLQDTADSQTAQESANPAGVNKMGALICVIVLAVGAPALYAVVGAPQALQQSAPPPAMDDIVARLQARVAEAPDDFMALYWLGRALAAQQKNEEAAQYFARAHAIAPETAELTAAYIDLLMNVDEAANRKKISQLLKDGLAAAPQDGVLLWLAGAHAEVQGQTKEAIALWRQAQNATDDPQVKQQLARVIADAQGGAVNASAANRAAAGAAGLLTVAVELRAPAPPPAGAALFVFARAAAANAPQLPLAVWRQAPPLHFPLTVILGDHLAMTPEHLMSAHKTYRVGAHIAAAAEPQAGDFVAANVTASAGGFITLSINARL